MLSVTSGVVVDGVVLSTWSGDDGTDADIRADADEVRESSVVVDGVVVDGVVVVDGTDVDVRADADAGAAVVVAVGSNSPRARAVATSMIPVTGRL